MDSGQALRVEIAAEASAHADALARVLDAAFGPGRFAKTSERVRELGARHRLDLSRVGLVNGAPVGCCRMYDILVGAKPALFLGPLAVDPAHQRGGLGGDLVEAALAASKAEGLGVIVVGAASFFQPFGFSLIPHGRVLMPGPVDWKRFQWLALRPGALDDLAGPVSAPRAASPR
ncbi:MAG: GNAT family N-acetyltransferase [Hyphomonadaceae bacterium]